MKGKIWDSTKQVEWLFQKCWNSTIQGQISGSAKHLDRPSGAKCKTCVCAGGKRLLPSLSNEHDLTLLEYCKASRYLLSHFHQWFVFTALNSFSSVDLVCSASNWQLLCNILTQKWNVIKQTVGEGTFSPSMGETSAAEDWWLNENKGLSLPRQAVFLTVQTGILMFYLGRHFC